VLIVSPPALNEIHRWLRDRPAEEDEAAGEIAESENPQPEA
jgi:hypothetical protein